MDQPIEVGPLQIEVTDEQVSFRFSDATAMTLEIPPSFEQQLREVAEDRKVDFEGRAVRLDLGNLPAISSRQLGMILTVREVMKAFGPLELLNISGSVRHLLKLTGTERFFKLSPPKG